MSRLGHWVDERLDLTGIRRSLLDRPVPHNLTWWHTLGSASLAVFIVQVVTGVVLAMYYSPSPDHAYESIRYLERAVSSGAVVRGIHHWGASAMVVLTVAHMIRVFTMGAYKYPREINWLLGVVLLFIVLGFSFTGYLLPWDQLAFWAITVGTNMAAATPLIGAEGPFHELVGANSLNDARFLLLGDMAVGSSTLLRFYVLHCVALPLVAGVFMTVHFWRVRKDGGISRPL